MLQTNLCFLRRGDEILLAMKKRRFGAGKWNGFGGKCVDDETPVECLLREAKEEVSVNLDPKKLKKVALIQFEFQNKTEWNQLCHVFEAWEWEGEPTESEEMRPQWYKISEVPYDVMWKDDRFWLPHIIKGELVKAYFLFTENGDMTPTYNVEVVDKLD